MNHSPNITSPVSGACSIGRILLETLQTGFSEDLGFGDISSAILPGQSHSGEFRAKADGVLSGIDAIQNGYQLLHDSVKVQYLRTDGDRIRAGELIAKVEGPTPVLLSGERVILNLMQHMSGIASATAHAVEVLKGSGTRICDTRKTIPGLRALQKYAVRCGGGYNHRLRLDDGLMIKDNHITAAGGVKQAVAAARKQVGLMVKIEVECETEQQVQEAVDAGADIIMLDNKTPEAAKTLCDRIPDSVLIELSGGITADTVGRYRNAGADYISLGSLTHSVQSLDISFNLTGSPKA